MPFDAAELSMVCELIAVASLCSWMISLTIGLGFCSADRALLTGIPGTLLGWVLFDQAGWPTGFELGGYPILPALVGTAFVIAVFAYGKRIAEERKGIIPRRSLHDWQALHRARP